MTHNTAPTHPNRGKIDIAPSTQPSNRAGRILERLAFLHPSRTSTVEQQEVAPSPLSVNGAQLRGLALMNSITRDYKGGTFEVKDEAAKLHQELSGVITRGDPTQLRKSIKKISKHLPKRTTPFVEGLVNALDNPTSVQEVQDRSAYDADFLAWLSTTDIKRRSDTPTSNGDLFLPELGVRGRIVPEHNRLGLRITNGIDNDRLPEWVVLPLDQQRVEWVESKEIYGSERETLQSRLEVFGALANKTDTVYTHVTGAINLPGFLTTESWGATGLRNTQGVNGLNVEHAELAEPENYRTALRQLHNKEKITAPIKDKNGKPSVISSHYIDSRNPDQPVILFDKAASEPGHREWIINPGGIGLIGGSTYEDPDLIGILVTPTYKENLLGWINSWPEAEKTRIFGTRPPETVLISSAADLPEKYRDEKTLSQSV